MGKLFIVTAPSGAGKTSLVSALLERVEQTHKISRVITHTTKSPRLGDRDGKDYHFLSVDQFEQKIKEDFFLEWSLAYGHYYGSPKNIVPMLEQGNSFLMILDSQGAQAIASLLSEAILIWISVPNIEILKKRLLLRKSENLEQVNKRILLAQKEIQEKSKKNFFKYVVCNDIFEKALLELESIVNKELM